MYKDFSKSSLIKSIYVACLVVVQSCVLAVTSSGTSLLSGLGAISGILCVGLLVFRSKYSFIFGMISNVCLLIIGVQHGVYSEMIQQPLFFLIGILGFYSYSKESLPPLAQKVQKVTTKKALLLAVVVALIWTVISYYLGSKVFYVDGILGGVAITAQLLEVGKNKLSWVGWLGLNILSIYTWFTIGNPVMVALYSMYAINSIVGIIYWNRVALSQK